ncbi:lysophospholipase A [Delitschia confertaspora ATCC 74209]|uniref:Lysophospholipase A n=1 Tax=Delitschia confertaspora ATCC 74209 TaxID=1513339 RepID=A0A9P4JMD5_9PLEO|nr:lysophospholipase A [Delitschia confertaspora ATCC 74209]
MFLSCLSHLFLLLPLTSAFPKNDPLTPSKHFSWPSTTSLIAFGDSYTYIQGTSGRQNFSFIGDLQNLAFTPQELLLNKIVQNQTGTAEGGPNWVQWLTGCGLREGLTDVVRDCGEERGKKGGKKMLWDFAFAGADISTEFTPLHHPYTVPLTDQIAQFTNYGEPALSSFVEKAKTLVTSWIGINDISDSAKYNISSFPSFYSQLQDRHFKLMEDIYKLGYRKFLFMNLPPLERTPDRVFKENPSVNKTMVGWFNTALTQHAETFQSKHHDLEIMLFDVNSLLTRVLDNPKKWGFTNTTGYCKASDQPDVLQNPTKYGCAADFPGGYFWWNSGHLTSRVHGIIAKELRGWLSGK